MRCTYAFVTLALVWVAAAAASDPTVRGVAPEQQPLFSGGGVACHVLGAAVEIGPDRVNDDYCDCDGGEDEPATAACSHLLSSSFFCRNGGFFPRSIPTSRVEDGVCDCCDGSDEGAQSDCADTCGADAEAFRQQALETLARTQRGFEQRQRAVDGMVREYFDDASQAALTVAQTLQTLEELKTRVTELKAREERKEAALRLAHARKAQISSAEADERVESEAAGEDETPTCVPDEASGSTCAEVTSDQVSTAELGGDAEEFTEMDAHDFVDEEAATDDASESSGAATAAPPPPSEGGSEVQRVKAQVELSDGTRVSLAEYLRLESESQNTKQTSAKRKALKKTPAQMRKQDFLGPLFNGDAEGRKRIGLYALRTLGVLFSPIRGLAELALFIPRTLWDLFVTAFKLDASQLPRSPSDVFHSSVVHAPWFRRLGEGSVYRGYHLTLWSAQVVWDAPVFVYQYLFPRLDGSIISPEAESLRRVVREIEDDIRALEKQRDEKREAAAKDFGPQRAYFALQDQCVERQVEKYTYKFCAFKEIKQDYTLLGKWDGWVDGSGYSRMRFVGGQTCWNGPERSVVVQLECGEENEIVGVEEPSTCEYEMAVRSPLACTHEVLEAAQRELTFWTESKR